MKRANVVGGGVIRCRMKDLVGKKARTMREFTNAYATVAKGTLVTVHGTHKGGFDIRTSPCLSCNVAVNMTKLQLGDLEFDAADFELDHLGRVIVRGGKS